MFFFSVRSWWLWNRSSTSTWRCWRENTSRPSSARSAPKSVPSSPVRCTALLYFVTQNWFVVRLFRAAPHQDAADAGAGQRRQDARLHCRLLRPGQHGRVLHGGAGVFLSVETWWKWSHFPSTELPNSDSTQNWRLWNNFLSTLGFIQELTHPWGSNKWASFISSFRSLIDKINAEPI